MPGFTGANGGSVLARQEASQTNNLLMGALNENLSRQTVERFARVAWLAFPAVAGPFSCPGGPPSYCCRFPVVNQAGLSRA